MRARNLLAWKARNLNLAFFAAFSVACVTWTFDIFGNFKMDTWTFQYVSKGFKLIIDVLGDYLMIKKRDCLDNKQDSFPKVVFVHVRLWKIARHGYQRIWQALRGFWQVLHGRKRKIRLG